MTARAGPSAIDGTPLAEAAAAAWRARHPSFPGPPAERQSSPALGQVESFFTLDLRTGDFISIEGELRGASPTTLVYVESGQWGYRVDQGDVDRILTAFDDATPQASVSPGEGIARIVESRFGPPTDVDGDGRVHILILDIRDGGTGSYVSGYYTAHDQTSHYGSNRRDLLYVDCYPADTSGNEVLGTAAHEYQHLVHYRQDPDESVFVNEGLSEYASHLCGYGLRAFNSYLGATDVPLDAWSNAEADYARVSLWTLYLGEQLGRELITELFRAPANGLAGVESALAVVGSPRSLADLLADWFVANAVNDRDVDRRFGYVATGALTIPRVEHTSYPAAVASSVSQLAGDLVRFRNVEGMNLRIEGAGVAAWIVQQGPGVPTAVNELAPGETLAGLDAEGGYDEVLLIPYSPTMFAASYSYHAAASPGSGREIAYDDGGAEELGVLDPAPGVGVAVRMTPEVHRVRLRAARFFVGATTAFDVHVWDDRGLGGMPGSDLIPPIRTQPAQAPGFHEVDLSAFDVEIAAGDFYLGAVGIAGPALLIGLDGSAPVAGRSVFLELGLWRDFAAIGLGSFDVMARAEVEYEDVTPPELRVGLLQHPVFSEQADLYVAGDEPLDGSSLRGVMRLGDETEELTLAAVGGDGRLFVDSSILLAAEGEGEVEVSGTSRYGTTTVTARLHFVVGRVGRAGGELRLDGEKATAMTLEIPAGALDQPATVTLQEGPALTAIPKGGAESIVTLEPPALPLRAPAELRLGAQSGMTLARWDGNAWEPVAAARRRAGEIVAGLTQPGTYALVPGEVASAGDENRFRVLAISPHPIRDQGSLALDLVRTEDVEVRLYDVAGRLRMVLFRGRLAPGRQLVPLDLRRVAGGPYLLEVSSGDERRTSKVVRLR